MQTLHVPEAVTHVVEVARHEVDHAVDVAMHEVEHVVEIARHEVDHAVDAVLSPLTVDFEGLDLDAAEEPLLD